MGLMLTTCDQNLFQVFIQRMKNAFKGLNPVAKLENAHLSIRIHVVFIFRTSFLLLHSIEEPISTLLRNRTEVEGKILNVQVWSKKKKNHTFENTLLS